MNLEKFRKSIQDGKIEWRKHVLQRLSERNIRQAEIIDILLKGEIIQEYPEDKPFPSALFLGFSQSEPVHIVSSFDDEKDIVYIITVYKPSILVFENDYRRRRKNE